MLILEHMNVPSNPTPDDVPQPSEEQIENARNKAQQLDEVLTKLGVFPRQIDLGMLPDGQMVLAAAMVPGELAWSEKVQNPVQHEMVEDLDNEVTESKVQEMRERARRLRETGEL